LIANHFVAALSTDLKSQKEIGVRLIEYIPDPRDFSYNHFHEEIAQNIVRRARREKILLSRSGTWIRADTAILLPADFIDEYGPLFTEDDMNTFLDSPLYYINEGSSTKFEQALSVLDCRIFDHQDVHHIITNPHFRFSKMPQAWFVRWFRFLFLNIQHWHAHIGDYRFLKLQDGTFTFTSPTQPVYLPSSKVSVPDRVDARILDRVFYDSVLSDADAKYFLTQSLGLSVFTDTIAVEKIVDYHILLARSTVQVPHRVLIDHAKYLRERQRILDDLSISRRNALIVSFQLMDAGNSRGPSSQITRNCVVEWCNGTFALSDIPSTNVRFLHQDYHARGLENFVWEFLTLSRYPPLLDSNIRLAAFYREDMSPQTLGDNRILYLFTTSEMLSSGSDYVRQLGKLKVFCQDKSLRELKHCWLPSTELKDFMNGLEHLGPMPWLDVSQPDHQKWKCLKDTGLTIIPDFKLYIQKLRRIKDTLLKTASLRKEVQKIYVELEKICDSDTDLVHCLRYPTATASSCQC
jgi:hypothetical protein